MIDIAKRLLGGPQPGGQGPAPQGSRTVDARVAGDPMVTDLYTPPAGDAAPALLLVHGWGGSGRYWAPTVARLRGGYRLIVPDLPGVGRSMPVAHARSMFDQVEALESLVDRLGVARLHLVGHSMGAGIAILLAARRPALVERLVLVGLSMFQNEQERAFFRTITEASGLAFGLRSAAMASVPSLVRLFATRFFHRVPDDPQLLREGFLDYLRMDAPTALASARSAVSAEIPAAAGRLSCPTLLIASRQDQVMPTANVPATAATIPGCRLTWIEECGHLPMVEKPDEFARLVAGFLEERG